MTKKKKVIRVSVTARQALMAAHHCGKSAVYDALSFNSESEQAQLIRLQALELYGGKLTERIIFN